MSGTTTKANNEYLIKAEFHAFKESVESSLSSTQTDMRQGFQAVNNSIAALNEKLDRGQKPNYTVILTMASMAAALVGYSVNQTGAMSQERDAAIVDRLNWMDKGSNRWTKEDHYRHESELFTWQRRQDDQISDHSKEIASLLKAESNIEKELAIRGDWIRETGEKVNQLDEKIDSFFLSTQRGNHVSD